MEKLYNELAQEWYQLLSPLHGYEAEADLYHSLLQKGHPPPGTVLELGCGAGHNAYFLKQWYKLTLSDLSEAMLAISKKNNPECAHYLGDMKTIRLRKTFDAVFIHDAIMYMTTTDELRQALQTAHIHCKPGGLILISPDHTRENFAPATEHGGEDAGDRGLRYLAWTHDPDPDDSTYTVDYAYLLRSHGETQAVYDRHVEGLFSESTWLALLLEAGFEAGALPDLFGRTNFLGRRID